MAKRKKPQVDPNASKAVDDGMVCRLWVYAGRREGIGGKTLQQFYPTDDCEDEPQILKSQEVYYSNKKLIARPIGVT